MRRDDLLDHAEKNDDEGKHGDEVLVRMMKEAMAVPTRIDTDTESELEEPDGSKAKPDGYGGRGVSDRRNSMGESVTSDAGPSPRNDD